MSGYICKIEPDTQANLKVTLKGNGNIFFIFSFERTFETI
jgi:hypothetical protein